MRARTTPLVTTILGVAAAMLTVADCRAAGAGDRKLTIFYTAEIHGTLEPCGCTSDPLGDIARYAMLVREAAAKGGAVLVLDAGGLSYPESGTKKSQATDAMRARFLAAELGKLGPFAAGLAETDLRGGPADVAPPRLAVNLPPSPALTPSVVKTLGGIKVGVFGVADPELAAKLGGKGEDPVAAGRREVARLRQAGAELVVALAPVDKPVARRLARDAGADLVVLGRQVRQGLTRAEPSGQGFIVASADEIQRVGRIDVVWRGKGPLVDAGGPEATALRRVEIEQAVARLDAELKAWATAGSGGDPAFIAAKQREREGLIGERGRLDTPWAAPTSGSYFTNRLVPLRRSLPRDPKIATAMRSLDSRIGAANRRGAAPPPPPEPDRPSYVGDAKCVGCHKTAFAFWKKTVHAGAWRTLVEGNKQDDDRCVSCHVTGYGEVGGTSLGHTNRLRDVQCEVCHGPGSKHVAEEGLEEPLAVRKQTPASTCTACHNEHHSDTFQYEAYLRDILGPGHGPSARKKLGDGPTGHELRTAALARAKVAGKAQVKKPN
jgi:cytochrome c554/c'-like protein